MAVGQPAYLLLIHRTRGQARSHIFMAVAGGNFASGTNQCRSWLACDGGGSARLFAADTPHSRASPLPQFWALAGGSFASGANVGGSWLACDGSGSARLFAADTPHSRASPLPHLGLCRMGNFVSGTNVGGSWLACDGGGSASLFAADTPHSRASPLPHLGCVGWEILRQAQISVGAGLPAMAVGQPDYLLAIHRIRGQARSHIWDWGGWEFCVRHKSVWELACRRWRWVCQLNCC